MRRKKKRKRPQLTFPEKTPEERWNARRDLIIKILFMTGFALTVWEVFLYRATIISVRIPLALWLAPGFILTPIFYHKLNEIDSVRLRWIPHFLLHYLLHTVITGGFVTFSFMAINYYGADSEISSERFEILEKKSLPGWKRHRNERLPVAVIDYHGLRRDIIFQYADTERFEDARQVALHVKKGLLGYAILEYQELILTDW